MLDIPAMPAPRLRGDGSDGAHTRLRGKDLAFVNYDLASCAEAVKRKREGADLGCR